VTRTRVVASIVIAIAIEAILVRVGVIADPIPHLAGTAAWTTSRAAGVTAFAALTLDVVFGLFVSTGLLDRWVPRGASIDVHRWLSSVALVLVGVHSLALLVDPAIHFDALDALVPGMSPYRAFAVALGVIAMHAALVVHLSFGWRKKIGVRAWRLLHSLAFAVYVLGVAHGLLAGSDAHHTNMHVVYASSAAVVGALVLARLAVWGRDKRPQAANRAAASH
jgi:sulfoxide reductase heme-binding subunit YedZ